MGKVNSLSKRLDWEIDVERDNENKTLVKPEQLQVKRTEKIEVIVKEVNLLEKVRQSKIKDNEVIKVVEGMKQARVKILRNEELKEIDSMIYKKEKVYVPKDDILMVEIIRLYYDIQVMLENQADAIIL